MFKQQTSTVTEVSFLPSNPSIALSCSKDGTVCIFDVRSNSCVHAFNESGHEFCSLSANNSGVVLAAASLNKTFLWDLRTMATWRTYDDLHTEDLTHIRFHPAHSHLLCTSSVDGLVNIMDNTKVREEDFISVTLSVDTSVSKFGFVGAGGEGMYVTTDIHGVQLWNLTTADRVCFVDDARPSMTANISGSGAIEMNYIIDGVFNAASNATGLFAGSDSGDVMVCSLMPSAAGLQIAQSAFGRSIHSDVVRCCVWNEAVRVVSNFRFFIWSLYLIDRQTLFTVEAKTAQSQLHGSRHRSIIVLFPNKNHPISASAQFCTPVSIKIPKSNVTQRTR